MGGGHVIPAQDHFHSPRSLRPRLSFQLGIFRSARSRPCQFSPQILDIRPIGTPKGCGTLKSVMSPRQGVGARRWEHQP